MIRTTPSSTHYDSEFYAGQSAGSRSSARAILSVVADLVAPRSVLDVGCGTGSWLAEWRALGVADVLGLDGDYVDRNQLHIPEELFLPADLTRSFDLGRRFDLVQSLEVAEHLEAPLADSFVDTLVRHGDVILFSAAVPGQGGAHHVNERWPSYWVPKFESQGFELFDVLRPKVWTDQRAECWYRQNVMIFARGEAAASLRSQALIAMPVLDVVHPEFLELLTSPPSGRLPSRFLRKVLWRPAQRLRRSLINRGADGRGSA